jgi:hypothetical protein
MEILKKSLIPFLVIVLTITGCYLPTAELRVVEGDSISQQIPNTVEIETPTATPIVSLEEQIQEIEVEEIAIPQEIQEETSEEEKVELERITRSLVDVLMDSQTVTLWYEQYWRSFEIVNLRCENQCSAEEIEDLLGPVFTKENWTAVQIGRVLYTHSGWDRSYGPEFGELFRRIIREDDSEPFHLCLGTECYIFVGYVFLGREELKGPLVLSQIFEDTQETDLFILTCDGFVDEDVLTPKLILQFNQINDT